MDKPEMRRLTKAHRAHLRIESDGDKFHDSHVFLDGQEIQVTRAVVEISSKHFNKVTLEFYAVVDVDTQAVADVHDVPRLADA